jgi:hypothetical protein
LNQRAKDFISQSIGKIPEDTISKVGEETEVKSQEATHALTTKCCYICGEEGHISHNCTRKHERFPTYIVEIGDQEFQDLLAREKPQKKKRKCNNTNKRDVSQV